MTRGSAWGIEFKEGENFEVYDFMAAVGIFGAVVLGALWAWQRSDPAGGATISAFIAAVPMVVIGLGSMHVAVEGFS